MQSVGLQAHVANIPASAFAEVLSFGLDTIMGSTLHVFIHHMYKYAVTTYIVYI